MISELFFKGGIVMYEVYCKLRDERGEKDATVSNNTGIPKSTFSDWKSGRSKPKTDKLQKIADYFGVTIEYLKTGNENEIAFSPENAELLIKIRQDKALSDALKIYFDMPDSKKKYIINCINMLDEV
jgi:transcriptional regulator with XRE-family HTH domain